MVTNDLAKCRRVQEVSQVDYSSVCVCGCVWGGSVSLSLSTSHSACMCMWVCLITLSVSLCVLLVCVCVCVCAFSSVCPNHSVLPISGAIILHLAITAYKLYLSL